MDTNAIRERWAGRTWRYVERRLGKDKAYLAECTLMVNGRTSGIWLDEPQPVEAEVLAAAAQAPEDVRALLARIDELESMLKAIASHECGDLGPNEAMCISGEACPRCEEKQEMAERVLSGEVGINGARKILASDDDAELQLYALSRLISPPPAVATALHRWRFEADEVPTILADLKTALEQA